MKPWSTRLFAMLVGIAAACALDDELENAECLEQADCWTNQDCVLTMTQSDLGIPGLCRPKGAGCLKGEQLGCACDIDGTTGMRSCVYELMPTDIESPDCLCVAPASTT